MGGVISVGAYNRRYFFCCLSVDGYISGGIISGGAYNRRYFLLFVGRWVYKWEGGVFYSVVFGMFDGSTI